ncbi:hypothetical protein CDAR_504921 [Caerostris darwini]|uniref:Uncharacterized protein n=1 Tax=Caerostris darwini TaxID=1538125 RepID=A0AAV4MPE4_9ARAC|nr:hypothetical protein CDAR_504921 [Caerostris darwini]
MAAVAVFTTSADIKHPGMAAGNSLVSTGYVFLLLLIVIWLLLLAERERVHYFYFLLSRVLSSSSFFSQEAFMVLWNLPIASIARHHVLLQQLSWCYVLLSGCFG